MSSRSRTGLLASLAALTLTAGLNETRLVEALKAGDRKAVQSLLKQGADVNAREAAYGETALMWAAAGNHAQAVRALIDRGADVNARSSELKYSQRVPKLTVRRLNVHASWAKIPRSAFKRSVHCSGVFKMPTWNGTPFWNRSIRSAFAVRVRR